MKRVLATVVFLLFCTSLIAQKIDRKALVLRHNIVLTKVDSLSPITLGNGRFAFTVDVTGLQSFPTSYRHGASLGIQSEWERNILKDTANYKEASDRQNLHLLQLGNLGFEIVKKDGTPASLSDIQSIYQELNLWTGKLRSHFTVEGIPVEVATYSSGNDDAIGVKVRSQLIKDDRLKIKLLFSYPTSEWANRETNDTDDKHQSSIIMSHNTGAVLMHGLDTAKYYVGLKWEGGGFIEEKKPNYFLITPDDTTDLFDLTAKFTPKKDFGFLPTFIDVRTSSENQWKKFWSNCEAINFSGKNDKKSFESERKIVLSQYLMRTLQPGSYASGKKPDPK